jgi:hypothetical protein
MMQLDMLWAVLADHVGVACPSLAMLWGKLKYLVWTQVRKRTRNLSGKAQDGKWV